MTTETEKKYKGATCRGCYAFGTACGKCEKCEDERKKMQGSKATENEKLEDALKAAKQRCVNADMVFYDKYSEIPLATLEQAARRYAEVLPLLGEMIAADNDNTICGVEFTAICCDKLEQIAAIMAEGVGNE